MTESLESMNSGDEQPSKPVTGFTIAKGFIRESDSDLRHDGGSSSEAVFYFLYMVHRRKIREHRRAQMEMKTLWRMKRNRNAIRLKR